jgi:hypothetical protein
MMVTETLMLKQVSRNITSFQDIVSDGFTITFVVYDVQQNAKVSHTKCVFQCLLYKA